MFKKDIPKIEFITDVAGLDLIEETKPKPSKYFIPKWWNSTPSMDENDFTVKTCPSFPDFFNQGYVIPAWEDMILKYDNKTEYYSYETPSFNLSKFPQIEIHPNQQFVKYVDPKIGKNSVDLIFKLNSPWKIITPKGYSVLMLPLFYHFDQDFSALAGIIDTDIVHVVNIQIAYYRNKESLFIKRGTPLAMYIPFKRTKYDYSVRLSNKQDTEKFNFSELELMTKFRGSSSYRKMQIKRDKDER